MNNDAADTDNAIMAEIERIERRSAQLSDDDANEAVELALAIAIQILGAGDEQQKLDEQQKRTLENMRALLDRVALGTWGLSPGNASP
jgi:hypothetical protein